ncbi:hypothetical protein Q0Z83_016230 [Actinoplanes sichuanensis]|uniref:HEAT repeat domain-containing protein n=1 Tax=Actinoplanes sichuanensis TaxID=512349 RepID=A0ABW4A860_9ACTN|nr:HEAT repeat domain-containing protein [Actinoplanes sichuanensis]BEL03432.1 hypothetical protein Q0Z83_016230 [Actinoplanes sichuanensis]
MGLGKARRIAGRAHRGQTFGDGLFTDHLERVAGHVAAAGGSATQVQAAWLYAVPRRGVTSTELYRAGVPAAVVRLVETVQQGPADWPETFTERLLRDPAAALIRYAVLTENGDDHPHLFGRQHLRLAESLGLAAPPSAPAPPAPDALATPPSASVPVPVPMPDALATPPSASVPVPDALAAPPTAPVPGALAPGEHLGPFARGRQQRADAQAAAELLAAYRAEVAGPARTCCLTAVRGSIYALASKPDTSALEPIRRMSEQWWDAADDWERSVAVVARAAARNPADRALLLSRVDLADPNVATAAISGLAGPGDDAEISLLRQVVSGIEPRLRWTRREAVRRLRAIGGPAAEAALRDRPLDPVDPPWRDDRGWLAANRDRALPLLLEQVTEQLWWHEGPFALGELRAVEAVPTLSRMAQAGSAQISSIEALGKIGSRDAVPTLIDLAGHTDPEVRDHALRALDRIGGPEVTAVAVTACDDPDPVVRDRAARVLARHGDERAVTALIRLCDTVHVGRAAAALGRIGDPRAVPTLWQVFRTSPGRRARHAAGRSLAAIDGPKQYLYLAGSDVHVRRAYFWLLGRKPDWKPQKELLEALTDSDPITRVNAIGALARLGDRAAAEPVRELRDDPDPRVRAAAGAASHQLRRHFGIC